MIRAPTGHVRCPSRKATQSLALSACNCVVTAVLGSRDAGETPGPYDAAHLRDGNTDATSHADETDCTKLSVCCAALPRTDVLFGCLIADGGAASLCAASLSTLQGVGYCTGTDAAFVLPVQGSKGGPPCMWLTQCCGFLPTAARGACNQVASEGTSAACSLAQMSIYGDGYCLAPAVDGGTVCTELAHCCESLPSEEVQQCKSGSMLSCAPDLASLRAMGYCGG
jgi:hypothetical protein